MLNFLIWWASIAVESLILFRGLRHNLFGKYPLFHAYIACVLIFSVSMILVLGQGDDWYRHWYWVGQLVTLIVGYGVMLEILNHTLAPYPGAERFGTIMVLGIFAAIFFYVMIQTLRMPRWSPELSTLELERDLRAVQAVVLAAILGIIFYYRIAIGRNLQGLIIGYGLYIGTSLVSLGVRAYAGSQVEAAWNVLQTCSYLLSLTIWAAALWSYQPNPVQEGLAGVEADYETLVRKTREMLEAMRSRMLKAARP